MNFSLIGVADLSPRWPAMPAARRLRSGFSSFPAKRGGERRFSIHGRMVRRSPGRINGSGAAELLGA